MLPKSRRLKTEDFKNFRQFTTTPRTQVVNAPHLLLRFFRVPPGKEKFAVIVSASTYKKAVERNLLRRRIYHIIAKHPFQPQKTLTVTVKKGALGVALKELEQEFLEATKKTNTRL